MAMTIDIDDATDPARFDRVNWTASNGEIDHMIAKVAFTRGLYPKNFDLAIDMHARYDLGTARRVLGPPLARPASSTRYAAGAQACECTSSGRRPRTGCAS